MEWKNIKETEPKDGQRVLVWNELLDQANIQTWNENYQCWDTEDGDDYEHDIDDCPYWMELPEEPKRISK